MSFSLFTTTTTTNNREFIRIYGCGLNFDSGTHERFHRDAVVTPFKGDARREEGQLSRLYAANNDRQLLESYFRERDYFRKIRAGTPTTDDYPKYVLSVPLGDVTTAWNIVNERKPAVARAFLRVFQGHFGPAGLSHAADIFGVFVIDYGEECIRFVNSPNYLNGGPR